jgi:hypothetical protein
VVVLQFVSKAQRRHWAARLIAELRREIVNLGANGIIIDKMYAQMDTRRVKHLLKVLGFTQISHQQRIKTSCSISPQAAPSSQQYKKALNKWLEEEKSTWSSQGKALWLTDDTRGVPNFTWDGAYRACLFDQKEGMKVELLVTGC